MVNDVKRILAYSTISQLGYMLAAIGLGPIIGSVAVSLGMFHLVSHAIFKALLFMSAGAFLIAMMDLRDAKQMGGLWKRMPITTTAFFIGALALVAFPGTSGYFSKDPIIYASYNYFTSAPSFAHIWPFLFLMIGSLLTTLYTFRMFFLVATGKPRSVLAERAKDPPVLATIPLMILSLFALILGIWQVPFYKFVAPTLDGVAAAIRVPTAPVYISTLPAILLAIGFFVDLYIYGFEKWKTWDISKTWYYKLVKNKFYIDVLYTRIISERVILPLSAAFSGFENKYNSAVNDLGSDTVTLGSYFRNLQNGVLENYVAVLILAAIVIFIIVEIVELM
ncbi:NADH dehydrogenase I chain J [Thermoplasma volcanium GSS1]|uniref:NADH dehydrogenase I chain J n=1 Tax=Thermoplasma volcanium (strain ATCC 51530 / DSM 4299 / JCM 9571 / NBRC 15438 / GSS1) TaxID=273116 RepID=Q979N0_THEVO|nr:NADH dehydrogenase I chain J [Thermoplasma volcanium GSS1]